MADHILLNILHNTEYLIQWVCPNKPRAHAMHKSGNRSTAAAFLFTFTEWQCHYI